MCSWGKFSSCSPQQTVLISFPILQVAAVLIYNGQRNYAVLIPASLHCLMRVFTSLTTPHFFILIRKRKLCIYYLLAFWSSFATGLKWKFFIYKARWEGWALDRGLEMSVSSQVAHACALGEHTHATHTPCMPGKAHKLPTPHTCSSHHPLFYFF